jgi:hypothetical protein
MHGAIRVRNQRYVLEDGSASSYLSQSCQLVNGQYSAKLADFIEEWSDDLGYKKLSKLLTQVTGSDALSASGVQSYLVRKAASITQGWVLNCQVGVDTISVCESITLYEQESKEVILMMDDVGVKSQKPHKKIDRVASDAKRLDTTVVLVQDSAQNYHYATKGIDKTGKTIYDIESAIKDKVCQLHNIEQPIPIVAITDGARTIRLTLEKVFGSLVCIILDWYHLQLKIKTLMTMIACNKDDKMTYIDNLKALLWLGEVVQAIHYIDNLPQVRNLTKQKELRDYLEKHQKEIINYDLRQKANKTIGSGRAEKANDLVIAHRQKKKGMAWARAGSSALAIIRVHRINAQIAA